MRKIARLFLIFPLLLVSVPTYSDTVIPKPPSRRAGQVLQFGPHTPIFVTPALRPDFETVLARLRAAQELARQAEEQFKQMCDGKGGHVEGSKCVVPPPPTPTPVPIVRTPSAAPSDATAYAATIAAARGWSWADWSELGNNESGWAVGRLNEWSNACGIGQALPCTKMYPWATDDWIAKNRFQVCTANGCKWFIPGDYRTEVDWMAGYIADRYKNTTNANAFWHCIGMCSGVLKKTTWY